MRQKLDDIEIIEPPIGELSKRHGSFGRACMMGCGFLVFLVIAAIVGLRLATGPGPKSIKVLPAEFPSDLTVYDRDNVERITFISGRYKNRGIEIAAFFPKVILAPLFMVLNKSNGDIQVESASSSIIQEQAETVKNFWNVITTPVGDHRDTVQIEWLDLEADDSFIASYYKNELKKNKFIIDVESEGQGVKQFSFSRESDNISGSLYIKADPDYRNRTENMILTVNMGTSTAQ